eukprot:3373579-Amphidinium_carterae.1
MATRNKPSEITKLNFQYLLQLRELSTIEHSILTPPSMAHEACWMELGCIGNLAGQHEQIPTQKELDIIASGTEEKLTRYGCHVSRSQEAWCHEHMRAACGEVLRSLRSRISFLS